MFLTNGASLAARPSKDSALEALTIARGSGALTVFDVDYRESSWSSSNDACNEARAALPWIDVVLGNEQELELLTGTADPARQAAMLAHVGVATVVRKLGSRGVEAFASGMRTACGPFAADVICPVGGGDAFAAGFLDGMLSGLPLAECLRRGNAAASIVVARVSCADAMPRRRELEERLRRDA
jgi:5-dehydro-2-deoxygluconokinase